MSAKELRRSPRQTKLPFNKRKDEGVPAKATVAPKRKAADVVAAVPFPAVKKAALASDKGKAAAVAGSDVNAVPKPDPATVADVTAAYADVENNLKKFDLNYTFGPCAGMKVRPGHTMDCQHATHCLLAMDWSSSCRSPVLISPCKTLCLLSITKQRIDRWNRADRLGLDPPLSVKKLIESHDSQWPLWHDAEGNTPF
jgi:hypothetical protein